MSVSMRPGNCPNNWAVDGVQSEVARDRWGIRALRGMASTTNGRCEGRAARAHNRSMQSQLDELNQALCGGVGSASPRGVHVAYPERSVQRALDLLVREPDVTGFFRGFIHNLVEESESQKCSVWLLSDDKSRCEFWMANVRGEFFSRDAIGGEQFARLRETMEAHLLADTAGWTSDDRILGTGSATAGAGPRASTPQLAWSRSSSSRSCCRRARSAGWRWRPDPRTPAKPVGAAR